MKTEMTDGMRADIAIIIMTGMPVMIRVAIVAVAVVLGMHHVRRVAGAIRVAAHGRGVRSDALQRRYRQQEKQHEFSAPNGHNGAAV